MLDPSHRSESIGKNWLAHLSRNFFIVAALLALLCGCSLPRIIVFGDSLSPEEHLKLGTAYESKGEYDLAVKEYKAASRSLPLAHLFLGNVYFLQKNYAAAEEEYRHAIDKLPENPRPYNNLAWLYYTERSKLEEAETLARRAVALAPPGGDGPYRDTLEHILKARAGEETPSPTQTQ
jgi:tetratricopeptide (TPR) repeat protein